jgi:phosphopantothenate synthetase
VPSSITPTQARRGFADVNMILMTTTKRREVALFNRNQRREQEINDALKQEHAGRAAVVKNMQRLKALRLSWDGSSKTK